MELWQFFLFFALLCAAIGVYGSRRSRVKLPQRTTLGLLPAPQGGSVPTDISVPKSWDETAISRQLEVAQGQPQVLTHYIDALKRRFVLKTEDTTAQYRTRFLRTHIEQLELGKQYQTLVNELKTMEAEQENRLLKLRLEQHELHVKTQQTIALRDIRLKKERLAEEVQIEELKAKKRALRKPLSTSDLTADQQRRLKRLEIEEKLVDLDRQETEALKRARNDEDRARIQNMFADKRDELNNQLSQYLV